MDRGEEPKSLAFALDYCTERPQQRAKGCTPYRDPANYLDEQLSPKYGICIGQYGSHKIAGSIEISRPHLN
jgi:hypothetical protein